MDHTTCLGLTIDNCLSWSKHICHIKKRFSQKVGALKRMRQLPPKVLEEIYFKSIIPAVIYGIDVWGNCSSAMLNSLNPIHDRVARLIHDQDDLQSLNWLPLSYFYKRRLLLFMFDVIKHNVPDDLASLFTLKSGSCLAVDLHEGEANLLFHVSNMKLANNLFNIEVQQFGPIS